MNIIILHGTGLVSMLDKLSALKKDFNPASVTFLSGKDFSFEQAMLTLANVDLFSDEKLYILEEFSEQIDLTRIVDSSNQTLVLKFTKKLSAASSVLKTAKGARVLFFDENKEISVFPFLDFLSEKNPKALVELEKLYKNFGSQYILTMIFYNLRKFIVPAKGPSFVLQKIEKQRKNFSTKRIEGLYLFSLETDYKIKLGLVDEKIGLNLLVTKFLA